MDVQKNTAASVGKHEFRFFQLSIVGLCVISLTNAHASLMTQSMVTESRLESDKIATSNIGSNLRYAFLVCGTHAWCLCTCLLPNGTYAMTDLLVTGGGNDTRNGSKIPCWSKRPKPGILPWSAVSIIHESTVSSHPLRIFSNLLDGVFGYDTDECYLCSNYLHIDLGEEKIVSRIIARMPSAGAVTSLFYVNIKIGRDEDGGRFEDYEFFASHLKDVQFDEEVIVEAKHAKLGRYLYFKRGRAFSYVQMCHLEIW